jgi:hypothetical protein
MKFFFMTSTLPHSEWCFVRYCDVSTLEGSPYMSEGRYDPHPQPRCLLDSGKFVYYSNLIRVLTAHPTPQK